MWRGCRKKDSKYEEARRKGEHLMNLKEKT